MILTNITTTTKVTITINHLDHTSSSMGLSKLLVKISQCMRKGYRRLGDGINGGGTCVVEETFWLIASSSLSTGVDIDP